MTPAEFMALINTVGWPGLISWAFWKPLIRTESQYQELQRERERERAEWQQREANYQRDIAKWQELAIQGIRVAGQLTNPAPGSQS